MLSALLGLSYVTCGPIPSVEDLSGFPVPGLIAPESRFSLLLARLFFTSPFPLPSPLPTKESGFKNADFRFDLGSASRSWGRDWAIAGDGATSSASCSGNMLITGVDNAGFTCKSAERRKGSSIFLSRRFGFSVRGSGGSLGYSSSSWMVSFAPVSLSRLDIRDALVDDRLGFCGLLNDDSLVGIPGGELPKPLGGSHSVDNLGVSGVSLPGSSLMMLSTENGSRRGVELPLVVPFPTSPVVDVPASAEIPITLALLFFSTSCSRNLSLLLMYINPR